MSLLRILDSVLCLVFEEEEEEEEHKASETVSVFFPHLTGSGDACRLAPTVLEL
jgi:hypothetical protein